MSVNNWKAIMAGTAMTLGCGCSSQQMTPPAQEPQSFGEYQRQEQSAEREEFIAEKSSRLDELANEIGRLEVKLKHEAKYVDAEERAEWSQELFELRQERDRIQAELARARSANDAEWAEMRGTLGGAVDTLEAGFSKVRSEVVAAFDGDDEAQPSKGGQGDGAIASDARLCPVDVEGVDVQVDKMNGVVVVTLTTSDAAAMQTLRQRAQKVAANGRYPLDQPKPQRTAEAEKPEKAEKTADAKPTGGGSGAAPVRQPTAGQDAQDGSVAVETQVQSVDKGLRLILKPKEARHLDRLYQQVQADKKTLGTGRCASS